jgi:hypothetical protein
MTRHEAWSLVRFVNRCADTGGGRYLAEPLVVGNRAWILLVDKENGNCPPLVDEVVDFVEALDRARLRGEVVPTGCRQMLLDWLQGWLAGDEESGGGVSGGTEDSAAADPLASVTQWTTSPAFPGSSGTANVHQWIDH